jgi:O-antigen/teichoic acid export membrane protein
MKSEKSYGTKVYVGTYATSLFIQVCTILQGALLARLLGPQGRGELAAIQLWPGIFASIGLLGINMALTRRAGKTNDTAPLIKSALYISCITGICTAMICMFFLPYLIPAEMRKILPVATIFLLYIPLNHMALNLLGIDQGAGDFKLFNFTRAQIYPVFFAGLILTWFFAENKLLWVVISLLAGNLTVAATRIILKWSALRQQIKPVSSRLLLREGLPYQITTIFSLFSQYIDQILLLWLLTPSELGLYVVARSSSSVIASLPASLGIVSLSEAARLDKSNGFYPLARMIRRGGILSGVLALLFVPFLPYLIPLVYGNKFNNATPVALILLLGIVCSGLSNIIEQSLLGHGKPLYGITAKAAGIIAILVAGSVGAHFWGLVGIGVGFTLSQIVVFFVYMVISLNFFENSKFSLFLPKLNDLVILVSYFSSSKLLSIIKKLKKKAID